MDIAVFIAQGGAALALGEGGRGFGGHRVSFQKKKPAKSFLAGLELL
jgi:hypothetical protein